MWRIRHTYANIIGDMKKKVVIDTNVLVSATRSRGGPSFALIQQVRNGSLLACCTPALFLEYEAVLKRGEHLKVSGLTETDIDAILAELVALVAPVATHYQWRPQLRDPSDEMVLEAAANASAHAIITCNLKDFAPASQFGIHVLNPQQAFLQFKLAQPNSTKRISKP